MSKKDSTNIIEQTTSAQKENNTSLVTVIDTVIKIPGIKVNREDFLRKQFAKVPSELYDLIIKQGPIKAGCEKKEIHKKAIALINERTMFSTGASFVAGMPGGLAMAATIPADIIQFYGVALRLAQELAYLYGEEDLWTDNTLDNDKVRNQLILYSGVMLGVTGAGQAVRVLSSALAKQALTKLPKQALTRTFYYPIIKSIVKFFGGKMTKDIFAKGVSKAIPVIGGLVSGGITLATMRPMGIRLANTLEKAHYDYTEEDFNADWKEIIAEGENQSEDNCDNENIIIEESYNYSINEKQNDM